MKDSTDDIETRVMVTVGVRAKLKRLAKLDKRNMKDVIEILVDKALAEVDK